MANDSEIKTGIDRFLELIRSGGETKTDVAAAKLGVSAETIEIWAEILQQDNVIEIGYDSFGKMTVRQKQDAIKKAPGQKDKSAVPKNENSAVGGTMLKKIIKKPAWQKRHKSKRKNIYRMRLEAPAGKDTGNESALSRILKRLGIKH